MIGLAMVCGLGAQVTEVTTIAAEADFAVLMRADDLSQPAPLLVHEVATGCTGGTWTADGRLIVVTAADKKLHFWKAR